MYKQQKVRNKLLISFSAHFKCFVSRQVLEDMEMLSAFTSILHVPNLSQSEHLMTVLEESLVFSEHELKSVAKHIKGKRYVRNNQLENNFLLILTCRIFIGIKKLLALIDMARQTDEKHRVIKLITKLQEDGCLED